MTRIIAIANQKGGVGKTTTTLNLGVLLARRGQRVLLVDLDPQASLTAFWGTDPYRVDRSAYSLMVYPDMTVGRVLRPIAGGMALVPGSVDLATAAIKLVQDHTPLDRLRHAMRETRVNFDFVLIDTAPGLNVLTVAGLIASDEILIPTQCSHQAIQGIRAIQDVLKRIREGMGNPTLKIRGVLPTFYNPDSIYATQTLDELRALTPVMKSIVPYDVNVSDAPFRGKVVVDYAPDSPGAKAYSELADEILADQTAAPPVPAASVPATQPPTPAPKPPAMTASLMQPEAPKTK